MADYTFTIDDSNCGCCACTTGTLSCRTRGGTATLCGFSENSGFASSPPKKYRTLTGTGGSLARQKYSDSGCTTNAGCDSFVVSGTRTYSSSTCVISGSGTYVVKSSASGACPATSIVSTQNLEILWPASASEGNSISGETATAISIVGNGTCYIPSDSPPSAEQNGTNTLTISDEDTEADAIARLLAGAGGTWGSWVAGTSTSCLARYEQRTISFSFVYQEAQWRITKSGLTPGKTYEVPIDYYRRTYGSGSYSLLSSNFYSGVADGSGNLDIEGDVPNLEGYETYAQQGTCP